MTVEMNTLGNTHQHGPSLMCSEYLGSSVVFALN